MKAVVFDRDLRLDPEHPEPVLAEKECLVRVHLAGICSTDLHITKGYMGFAGILGHEMVGTVLEGPPEWRGKRVVSEINCVCRTCEMCQAGLANHCRRRTVLGIDGRDGVFADLVAVPAVNLHEVPDAISDEEAVFVEPLAAAYQVLVQCRIERRMHVSVVGAGRLGLLVAQALKQTGSQLTAIDRDHDKLLLCEKKGIQAIHVDDLVLRQDRDVVVDCTGSPDGLALAMHMVRPRGTIVLKSTYATPDGNGGAAGDTLDLAPLVIHEINLLGSRCGPFPEAINALARQAVDVRSMISRTFPLDRAIEAFDAARDAKNLKVLLKVNPG